MFFLWGGALAAQPSRINGPISAARRFTLGGQVHPEARSEYDRGPAAASLELDSVTLVLKPSASQQAELDRLLAEQQDAASKSYHQWLTPEQYAERFGASQDDIGRITAWLEGQGLTVTNVARARNAVSVKGTAGSFGTAFRANIRMYLIDGESHYANATDPTLPAALQGMVQAIHGLHNFRLKARARKMMRLDAAPNGFSPAYTGQSGNHYLAPDDFTTIFNVNALLNSGYDGTGQKIVVVGQSRINTGNLAAFRANFGLSSANLTTLLVPNTRDPGTSDGDAQESDLDLEWASGVARNVSLIFVYSYDVTDAVQYAIDQNLAPVLSMSYGMCEESATQSDTLTLRTWAKQANAQGITWVASSGDSGAADCYQASSGPFGGASSSLSLATDIPASIPEVTAIGGTTLSEGSGSYWNSSNYSTTKASALAYIPETSWNDSATNDPASSGGGASQFFSKPSWQTGPGVPNDGARDVPDVSYPASAQHDGYMVYTTSGRDTGWYVFGGTSAGAPSFAGVLALLNQYVASSGKASGAGLGNVNTKLYSMAASSPAAFHDVTTGNNIVSATSCTGPRCTGGTTTTSVGYSAGAGYDQVTGLGSVDAYNFVLAWATGSLPVSSTVTITLEASPASISASGSSTLKATVTSGGSATPTGTVTFKIGGVTLGTGTLAGAAGTATSTLTLSGSASMLSAGSNTITVTYDGDPLFSAAAASTTLALSVTPSISGIANGASWKQTYAPGMILSIFGAQLASSTSAATTIPLPTSLDNAYVTVNGAKAPVYYISPTQVNAQIPYETAATGTATVVVSNNGQTASATIAMSAAAPGIFTDTNGALVVTPTAARGQTIELYVTGQGAVSPTVPTGALPASGVTPAPAQVTVVTVGGATAATTYIGIPSWSIGVLQIDFTVPLNASLGSQPVVVTIGGVASAAASLTVTQ